MHRQRPRAVTGADHTVVGQVAVQQSASSECSSRGHIHKRRVQGAVECHQPVVGHIHPSSDGQVAIGRDVQDSARPECDIGIGLSASHRRNRIAGNEAIVGRSNWIGRSDCFYLDPECVVAREESVVAQVVDSEIGRREHVVASVGKELEWYTCEGIVEETEVENGITPKGHLSGHFEVVLAGIIDRDNGGVG